MQRLQHAHDATQGRAYFVAHRGQQHHVGLRSRGGFIAGHNQFASGSAFCGYISNDTKHHMNTLNVNNIFSANFYFMFSLNKFSYGASDLINISC